jgi:hypothetical protein
MAASAGPGQIAALEIAPPRLQGLHAGTGTIEQTVSSETVLCNISMLSSAARPQRPARPNRSRVTVPAAHERWICNPAGHRQSAYPRSFRSAEGPLARGRKDSRRTYLVFNKAVDFCENHVKGAAGCRRADVRAESVRRQPRNTYALAVFPGNMSRYASVTLRGHT